MKIKKRMARRGGRPQNKRGRPEAPYDAERYPKLVLYLRRQKDMTDAKISEMLGVSLNTMKKWCRIHPEFLTAYKTSLLDVKAELLDSAYARANGYSHNRKTVMVGFGEVEIEEYFPKDTHMIKFLAGNVLGMIDTQHITTPPGQPFQVDTLPDVTGMAEKEKAALREMLKNMVN